MKPRRSNQRNRALTLSEVLVIVATLWLLAAVALAVSGSPGDAQRKICVNNLKQIADAFRTWAGDNGDRYPAQVPDNHGGAMEEAVRGDVAPVFQVMSNELSTPRILVCPADIGRFTANNFVTDFNNSHVSNFIAVDTGDDRYSQRLLSGDSSLAVGGVSVKSGLAELSTNAVVSWTPKRHFGEGNIDLADGSVWQTDNKSLAQKLCQTGLATNRLAIP